MNKFILTLFFTLLTATIASAYNFEVDGVFYNKNSDGQSLTVTYKTTSYNSYSGDVVIPSTVTLSGITYNVTAIGDKAFYKSSNLTSVIIGDNVTSIGESAFYQCKKLTSVDIPNSVVTISDLAFEYCSGITSVHIGDGVTSLGQGAFEGCTTMTELTLGNSLTTIGEYAFNHCNSLPSLVIPNSVVSIGGGAFNLCSAVTSLTIGKSVTSIGDYAFSSCSSLETLTIDVKDPASITMGEKVFSKASVSTCTLMVPEGSIEAYSTADQWSAFSNIEEIVSSFTLNKTTMDLGVGESEQLTVDTSKTLTWSSSDEAVATVDAQGNVFGVSVGTATITASCGSATATCEVTVKPILAASVTLDKTSIELFIGSSETLVATVLPENTSDKTVIWNSSNSDVAKVDATGNVTALAVGTATITATSGTVSAVCEVTVTPIVASSVQLNKSTLELLIGESETLVATVLPENTTDKTVFWTSSDKTNATVDSDGKVTALAVGTTTITASCGEVSATCEVTVNPIVASTVTLNKSTLELLIGASETLVATVFPENTTDKTITWTSSNETVATVDAEGKVTAVTVGTATITASCGSATATCEVTVNPIVAASVELNKSNLELLIGASETLVAIVLPENTTDKTVTWTSSDEAVATVNADGNVTAVALGTATITAICGSATATCEVTVNPILATSVELNKSALELLIGSSETLVAIVLPENTTDKTVTWTSSDESVATVDAAGNVTAVALGTATITATCGTATATCTVTVNPIVASTVTLNKNTLDLIIGESETLVATVLPDNTTDKTVTWSSSDEAVATVDSDGNVTAVALGTATITASCGSATATCEVTVKPILAASVTLDKTSIELFIGSSETLVATVLPENTTDKTVTWTSSDEAVATVDAEGNVTAVALGTATITAICGSATATCEVTVNPIVATSVELNKSALELFIGSSETLVATVHPENTTDKTVTWTSSDEAVATVDSEGKVTAVALGTATITASCGSATATCEVTVNPIVAASVTLDKTSIELLIGASETLVATVLPENTTDKTVIWTSSDEAVATVDAEGNVTAVALGTATITATCGSSTATCEVTVKPFVAASVELNKSNLELLIGASETLVATVLPENTTDKTVTWTSSDEAVATVDADGNVTAVVVGTATITATCGEVSATCEVTVNPIVAASVTLDKTSIELLIGASETLVATVLPENTTDKTVIWTSSDEDVATVDAEGKVTAVTVGTATITASCGSVTATCEVTVNPIVAASVTLNKTTIELLIGASETLVATVLPENTTDKTVIWTSSDEDVATVDADGNVTAVVVGTATITATCGEVSATCEVTVNPIVAASVELDMIELELPIGESAILVATVLPESTTDKTVTWTSSDEAVATVDAEGNVTAVAVGTATITASCGDVSATCEATVIDPSTGVKDVNNDVVYMHAEGCELVIAGLAEDVSVNVFTLDGKLVYTGNERRISLQNGNVYVVTYPGGSRKVAF